MSMENEYKNMDFSQFSKVKDSLFQKMLAARHAGSGRQELDMDELDYVAAAGRFSPASPKPPQEDQCK